MASARQPIIRPISSSSVVENGALIVVAGKPKSGKTCIVENALYHTLDSFLTRNFAPLYIGESSEFGSRYFGRLFNAHLVYGDGDTARQAEIWQLGYAQERADAQFCRQGAIYLAAQAGRPAKLLERPRLLFYFDKCHSADELNFAAQCLKVTPNHRAAHSITLLETESMLQLGLLPRPEMLVFTSRLDSEKHVAFFANLLETSRALAQDLVDTANTFIEPCHVALLINLHQWYETDKRRGLFIYEYDLVPPLDEQLETRRVRRQSNETAPLQPGSERKDAQQPAQQPAPQRRRRRRRRCHQRENGADVDAQAVPPGQHKRPHRRRPKPEP